LSWSRRDRASRSTGFWLNWRVHFEGYIERQTVEDCAPEETFVGFEVRR
jgi:hypothetical protein